jgi:hypothetical protein
MFHIVCYLFILINKPNFEKWLFKKQASPYTHQLVNLTGEKGRGCSRSAFLGEKPAMHEAELQRCLQYAEPQGDPKDLSSCEQQAPS